MKPSYDVVIVGAGMSGLTLAALLGGHGLRLGIIDTLFDEKAQHTPIENTLRVSAFTPSSWRIWERLGIWSNIPQEAIGRFDQIKVWIDEKSILFDKAQVGFPALAYVIENALIRKLIYQMLREAGSVAGWYASPLQAISSNANFIKLELKDQMTLTAQLVVGADGVSSTLRQLAGIVYPCVDYQEEALVATVRHSQKHQYVAQQVFLALGPLAFLPLSDDYTSSIVWTTRSLQAKELQAMLPSSFCWELSKAFSHRLGTVQSTSKRLSFPLYCCHAQTYIKPRIALLGDAAHRLHPLAGQGANLGIADATCLADVILANHRRNRCLGSLPNLRPYERLRRSQNNQMLTMVGWLRYLLTTQYPLMKAARKLGVRGVNSSSFLKNFFIRCAS